MKCEGRGLHLDGDVPIVTPTVQQTERPADAAEAHTSMGKMELVLNAAAKMMNAAVTCELTSAEVWTLAKTAIQLSSSTQNGRPRNERGQRKIANGTSNRTPDWKRAMHLLPQMERRPKDKVRPRKTVHAQKRTR